MENILQLHRSELIAAVGRLSNTQARRHLVPSLTTPISLVKHCAAAERIWFQHILAGRRLEDCTGQAVGGDMSFHVADQETLDQVVAEYVVACATSDDIAARHNLDDTAQHSLVGAVSLRFFILALSPKSRGTPRQAHRETFRLRSHLPIVCLIGVRVNCDHAPSR